MARCDQCGADSLTPHQMECPRLAKIVASEQRGICSQCGDMKLIDRGWDEDMQMVVTTERCPNGHSHGMSWRRPSKRDIRQFGLVKA
jgi:hypothetical protein